MKLRSLCNTPDAYSHFCNDETQTLSMYRPCAVWRKLLCGLARVFRRNDKTKEALEEILQIHTCHVLNSQVATLS